MLTLKQEDADSLRHCREVLKNCAQYKLKGDRHFTLIQLMYNELEKAGLIRWEEGVKR